MVIEKLHVGAHGRKIIYAVCADQTETGDKLHEIARYETLELATIVMRYMSGFLMGVKAGMDIAAAIDSTATV